MSVAVAMDPAPTKRSVGRPSKAAAFRSFAADMILEQPQVTVGAIFTAAVTVGYDGKKSAFYAMVADVRDSRFDVKSALASLAKEEARRKREKHRRRLERAERRALRAAERQRLDAADAERIARQARERMEEQIRRETYREDRKVDWQALQFHPTGMDEDSMKLRVLARRWFDSRDATHKANYFERRRWRHRLAPTFGHLEPGEVDAATIRAFVEEHLAAGISPGSVGNLIRILSSLFTHLVDEGAIGRNPVQSVPRRVRLLYRNQQDPRATPFLERMEDIGRLRASLTDPLRSLFSLAVLTGIRPGELVALEWSDLRSDLRLMHIQRRYLPIPAGRGRGGIDVPKSGKSRVVPVSAAGAEVLRSLRDQSGPTGLVFKSPCRRGYYYVQQRGLRQAWLEGLKRAGLPYLTFYQATRHTFASQWVMAGHSIEKLSKILGHSSVTITEVYAHLKPESLSIPDFISFGAQTTTDLAVRA